MRLNVILRHLAPTPTRGHRASIDPAPRHADRAAAVEAGDLDETCTLFLWTIGTVALWHQRHMGIIADGRDHSREDRVSFLIGHRGGPRFHESYLAAKGYEFALVAFFCANGSVDEFV